MIELVPITNECFIGIDSLHILNSSQDTRNKAIADLLGVAYFLKVILAHYYLDVS